MKSTSNFKGFKLRTAEIKVRMRSGFYSINRHTRINDGPFGARCAGAPSEEGTFEWRIGACRCASGRGGTHWVLCCDPRQIARAQQIFWGETGVEGEGVCWVTWCKRTSGQSNVTSKLKPDMVVKESGTVRNSNISRSLTPAASLTLTLRKRDLSMYAFLNSLRSFIFQRFPFPSARVPVPNLLLFWKGCAGSGVGLGLLMPSESRREIFTDGRLGAPSWTRASWTR